MKRQRLDPETNSDSARVEETKDVLEFEIQKNADVLARDLHSGLSEILAMLNAEELRILFGELEIKSTGSKQENLETLLHSIAGNEETQCRIILRSIWEGIIIEYLRKVGKNLMKCRDDLRGNVIKYWKRNTIVQVASKSIDNNLQLPVYMRNTVWKRVNPTSDKDAKIKEFLSAMYQAEESLKSTEKKLRLRPNYETVILFLARIHNIRDLERDFRSDVLSTLQVLLGERDLLLENESIAIKSKNNAERKLHNLVLRETSTSFFRGVEDIVQRNNVLSTIAIQVQVSQKDLQTKNLLIDIGNLNIKYDKRERKLLVDIRHLQQLIFQNRITLKDTQDQLNDTNAILEQTTQDFHNSTALFTKYRDDAQAFVERSVAANAALAATNEVNLAVSFSALTQVIELQQELEKANKQKIETQQELERWQMNTADFESKLSLRMDQEIQNCNKAAPIRGRSSTKRTSTSSSKKVPKSGRTGKQQSASPAPKSSKLGKTDKRKSASPASKSSKSPSKKSKKRISTVDGIQEELPKDASKKKTQDEKFEMIKPEKKKKKKIRKSVSPGS